MEIASLEVLTIDCIKLLEKNNLLYKLIAQEVQEEKLLGVEINEEEKINLKNIFLAQNGLKTEEDLQNFLNKTQINEELFYSKICKPLKVKKYSLNHYIHMVEGRFIKKKDDLDSITYSLLRVSNYNLSQELFYRIQDGDSDFGKLSSEFSEGLEKNSKGIIGPVSISQTHPILRKLLISSKVGELNQPIKVNDFWVISRLESFNKAKLNDEMKLFLAQQIFEENIQEISVKLHGNLKSKTSAIENVK